MIISRAKDKKHTTEIFIDNDKSIRPIYSGQLLEDDGLGTDFRPSQLILAGYAACMNITLRNCLQEDNVAYDDVIVSVDMDGKGDTTKFYSKIEIIADISNEEKSKYIEIAKNCYVKGLLASEKEFLDMK